MECETGNSSLCGVQLLFRNHSCFWIHNVHLIQIFAATRASDKLPVSAVLCKLQRCCITESTRGAIDQRTSVNTLLGVVDPLDSSSQED